MHCEIWQQYLYLVIFSMINSLMERLTKLTKTHCVYLYCLTNVLNTVPSSLNMCKADIFEYVDIRLLSSSFLPFAGALIWFLAHYHQQLLISETKGHHQRTIL